MSFTVKTMDICRELKITKIIIKSGTEVSWGLGTSLMASLTCLTSICLCGLSLLRSLISRGLLLTCSKHGGLRFQECEGRSCGASGRPGSGPWAAASLSHSMGQASHKATSGFRKWGSRLYSLLGGTTQYCNWWLPTYSRMVTRRWDWHTQYLWRPGL